MAISCNQISLSRSNFFIRPDLVDIYLIWWKVLFLITLAIWKLLGFKNFVKFYKVEYCWVLFSRPSHDIFMFLRLVSESFRYRMLICGLSTWVQ